MRFLVFFAIVAAVLGLGHGYLWLRLVRAPGWPAPWRAVLTAVVVALAILLPLAMPLARQLPRAWSQPLSYLAFGWMGLGFLLIVSVALTDLASWLGATAVSLWGSLRDQPADPMRREVLARGAAGVASVAAVGLGGVALRGGLGDVEVKEVGVKLERLPRQLSGMTLVQLSDVHIGPTLGRRFLDQVVEKANAQRPDAVVITGDLVDGSVAELSRHVAPLARLKARHGVYFITGNHEYYSGAEAWIAELERLGIRVLRNERVTLGDAAASIDLAGVDDLQGSRFGGGHGMDLARALAGRDPERELVLLAHQPKAIEEAARAGVGLQLSGHTHGGQIWPFDNLVKLQQPYVRGLHRHGDLSQIYVSCGTGFWGPPMRLGAPAEVTKIVLS